MSKSYDALVVGGGVEGLVAVSLLARSGLRAQLLERSATPFGHACGATLNALDPRVVKELRLARRGLRFAARDLSLTVLRNGGANAVIGRDRHATARSLAALSPADAAVYAGFRAELFALARALRPAWWDGKAAAEVHLKPPQRALFARLGVTGASAWLGACFESETLRAALAFAAAYCGAAPSEAGSALALVWAAAQEMNGQQGAVAIPRGGVAGLLRALAQASQACGAEIRTAAPVVRVTLANEAVSGVELADGETVAAPLVLSALSRRRTLLELLPPGAIGLGAVHTLARLAESFGCATLVFTLVRASSFDAGMRFVVAERPETYEAGLAAIRLAAAPRELALELVASPPEAAQTPPAPLTLTVRAWPVAASYDRNDLVRTVGAMIERHAPGFLQTVNGCDVLEPPEGEAFSVARLLAGAAQRIETSVPGLLLCGPDAEPVHAISGRAARQAAGLAIALHRKAHAR